MEPGAFPGRTAQINAIPILERLLRLEAERPSGRYGVRWESEWRCLLADAREWLRDRDPNGAALPW